MALDLATHRVPVHWRDQIDRLKIFDSMTGQTMTYLINGPPTVDRCVDFLRIAGGPRIRFTNATTQVQIPKPRLRSTGDQTGITFAAPVEVCRNVFDTAAAPLRSGQDSKAAA